MSRKILVVAAHPDDEILGCGATVARHAKAGDTVWSLILGEGVTSRKGQTSAGEAAALKALREHAAKANKILGVKKLIFREFPDNAFDSVALLEIAQAIEAVLAQLKPDTVYTHSSADLNIDHRRTADAVRAATRPQPGSTVRRVLAFETASATEWRFDAPAAFRPNLFVDVAKTFPTKLKALACYRGEMRPFPHPRSLRWLKALSEVRGGQAGFKAAEAFELVRETLP
jgi:LmbE family N-acetylglucosaminyl deacetylase